jgi:uncharacterized protein
MSTSVPVRDIHKRPVPLPPALFDRLTRAGDVLRSAGSAVVAFSGGVDSTLVLRLAIDALGADRVLAVTGVSPSLPARELDGVKSLARQLGVELTLVDTNELARPGYVANGPDRCFHCKTELYTRLGEVAAARGLKAVANGVNRDDADEPRPGVQAARKFGVMMPLLEAGLRKDDVRALAGHLKLPNAEKPALACLASRLAFGTPVTIGSLAQIEQAEAFLWERGFQVFRVRHHGKLARVEVAPGELSRLLADPLRSDFIAHCKRVGYTYVTVDLQGFRSGSAHEAQAPAADPHRHG